MNKSYFLIMLVLGFCSCKKESPHDVVNTQVDVYVAGFVSGDANSMDEYPTYWENDSPVQLNISNYLQISRAYSM